MMAGSNPRLPLAFALAAVWALPLSAQPRHVDAHTHGMGKMTLVIAGSAVSIQLTIPGSDIVGFERQAQTPEEQSAVDSAIAALSNPLELFAFSPDRACAVTAADAHFGAHDEADTHDHDEDHAEFTVNHTLDCPDLAAGNLQFRTRLFDEFDGTQNLTVEGLVDGVAVLGTLSREQAALDLR